MKTHDFSTLRSAKCGRSTYLFYRWQKIRRGSHSNPRCLLKNRNLFTSLNGSRFWTTYYYVTVGLHSILRAFFSLSWIVSSATMNGFSGSVDLVICSLSCSLSLSLALVLALLLALARSSPNAVCWLSRIWSLWLPVVSALFLFARFIASLV